MATTSKFSAADGAASLALQEESRPSPRRQASPSLSSFRSALSKLKMESLSVEKRLTTLEANFFEKEAKLNEEQEALVEMLEAETNPAKMEALKVRITRADKRMERLVENFQKHKAVIEKELVLCKKMEDLEENNDQRLGSDDEAAVIAFDRAQQREVTPPTVTVVNPNSVLRTTTMNVGGTPMTRTTVCAIPEDNADGRTEEYVPTPEPERVIREDEQVLRSQQQELHEVPERVLREQAELRQRQQAYQQQQEQAELLQRQKAYQKQQEQAELLQRQQAYQQQREQAELLQRQQAYEQQREQAELLQRQQAYQLEREQAEMLQRQQAYQRQREEVEMRQRQAELNSNYQPQPDYRNEREIRRENNQHWDPYQYHQRMNDMNMNPSEDRSAVEALTAALSNLGNRGSSIEKRLPEFSGDPSQWGNFYSAFKRSTQKYRIEDGENLMRLQASLKGEAKAAVEHLMANVLNVSKILDTLKQRFGRPEFVLDYLVEKAKKSKPPDLNKPKTIVDFGTSIEALVTNILAFKEDEYLYNKQLVTELVEKLPGAMKNSWFKWLVEDRSRKPNLRFFSQWMEIEVQIAQLQIKPVILESKKDEKGKEDRKGKRSYGINATEKESSSQKCLCCDKPKHFLKNCFKFQKLSYKEKKGFVRDKELCFKCLKSGHQSRECKKPVPCNEADCPSPESHHPALHFKAEKVEVKAEQEKNDDGEKQVENQINSASARSNILPIIPVYLKGPKGKVKVYALLDSGSSFCCLEEEVAQQLGLKGPTQTLSYTVFGDRKKESSQEVSLDIRGDYDRAQFYNMKRVFTVKKMKLAARTFDAEKVKEKYPHLSEMKAKSIRNARPQLVLGTNVGGLFAARQILESAPGEVPAGVRSLLGWYLIEDEDSVEKCLQFALLDEMMHEDIRQFVTLENLGVKEEAIPRSREDKVAMKFMESNTKLDQNKWTTALPWRNENESLPPSRDMALKRLYSMERKMDKNSEFSELCQEKFAEYINSGYLVKVDKFEAVPEGRKWYLPWFFVHHPNKKPRLVFDAAAKSNGKSLNDFLLTGPDLLQPLHYVLMRFRRHQIALTADIQQMFHQINLRKEDHPSQTLLYRGTKREGAPDEYHMSVLFFGAVSSPSLACYTKIRNAERFENDYPDAVKATKQDSYMDDYLTGADTEESTIKLQQDLMTIHESGGFPLVKWMSSNDNVLQQIPNHMRAEGALKLHNKEEELWEKTLGLLWNPETDDFSFNLSFSKLPEKYVSGEAMPTKRIVTSIVMSVFDPLGFLASLKIKGLLIIQTLWRNEIGWDDEIGSDTFQDWRIWLEELKTVTGVRIPRKLSPISLNKCKSIQLHCFCDASEDAYACAVYLRIDTGEVIVTPFVMGKVRVAPKKKLSVPRLELNAALIGTRVVQAVKQSMSEDLPINQETFWSDSKTVLHWIRASDKRYKTYVANRIAEIETLSRPQDWKWVPSAENVADDATRFNQSGLKSQSRWINGPEWLRQDENKWPEEEAFTVDERNLELKSIQAASKEPNLSLQLPDKEKFSCWYRLIRATAAIFVTVRRFKSFRKECNKLTVGAMHITVEDMKRAKTLWIRQHQAEYFFDEIEALKSGNPVSKQSRIIKLSPSLNHEGIIVLKGRLENSELDDSSKFPPILDPKDKYVRLMIKWFHKTSQHYGQERIINELRKHVWILNIRQAVRKVKSECLICRFRVTKPQAPEMGQLPLARVEGGNKPFHHTGVDYFGPMFVTVGRKTLKRWGVIFTCMATRAIHLELSETLETNEFIKCLIRFMCLRGCPSHIWSDNGTNFVGAEREIRENLEAWNQTTIRESLAARDVQWHFIPPASPHMGGVWERLIRCTKRILLSLLKEQSPGESTLRTFLSEVTAIMNSRPITSCSPDPEDPRCITPNDLLQMDCVVGPTIAGDISEESRVRDSWKRSQRLAQEFWKRWSAEYLPWLAQRRKWNSPNRSLKIGDHVLLTEENAPRNEWKKGVITQIFPSRDGQIRFVEVKITRVDPNEREKKVKVSYLKRPVVKLCPLLIN